jgi:Transcriptional regulatory protein, C terminal
MCGSCFAAATPLVAGWLTAPGWHDLISTLALETLEDRDALALLDRSRISSTDAWRIIRLTRGHPLALKLAVAATGGRRMTDVELTVLPRVVEELTRLYLADIDDLMTRHALAASSVVRRTTLSLLAAMLPDVAPQEAHDRLLALPFVETSREGLQIHDTVQQVVAATLKSADPTTYRTHRRAAWRQLRAEVRTAGAREMWRYTADMLYIIENPVTREAFFPTNAHRLAVEAARPADEPRIRTIVKRHEGRDGATWLMGWWQRAPQAFRAIRDHQGMLTGLYALFDPATLDLNGAEHDPIVGQWLAHLQRNPIGATEQVLFCLRWLSETGGEAPAPEQAAAWLDMKRSYMEMRPRLRRVYMPVVDIATYGPIAAELGFRLLDDLTAVLDGKTYHTALLDFGPQSVDGWLTGLVAQELGLELGLDDERLLDIEARELVLGSKRVPLTPLEFDVMRLLIERAGTAISCTTLLDTIWGIDYEGGSNVVDAVIRLLRRKLGSKAGCIETVSGIGYRFRARPDRPQP